jgi:hypothetical protein
MVSLKVLPTIIFLVIGFAILIYPFFFSLLDNHPSALEDSIFDRTAHATDHRTPTATAERTSQTRSPGTKWNAPYENTGGPPSYNPFKPHPEYQQLVHTLQELLISNIGIRLLKVELLRLDARLFLIKFVYGLYCHRIRGNDQAWISVLAKIYHRYSSGSPAKHEPIHLQTRSSIHPVCSGFKSQVEPTPPLQAIPSWSGLRTSSYSI